MMKLSAMRKVVGSVDENWRSTFAASLLTPWGYDEGSVYFYRSSANSLFVFQRDGKECFLRCIESSEKDLEWIAAELELLNNLYKQGVPTVRPVQSKNGRWVEVCQSDLGEFYAVVFEKLSGNQLEIEDLTDEQFNAWGAALGKLHRASQELKSAQTSPRSSWQDHLTRLKTELPPTESAAKKEYERLESWANGLSFSEEDVGIIHYDFELDNLIWTEDYIHILDFDDAAVYWYAADIAYALRDLFHEGVDFENQKYASFVEGYKREHTLNEKLLLELPMYLRMHNLFSFLKLLGTVDIPKTQDDPDWLKSLRNKLVTVIDRHRTQFEGLAESDALTLQPLNRDNWEQCAALSVKPEQQNFIASNVHSIAEAQFLPGFSSLAICLEDRMIGYTLFGPDPDDNGIYWIYRLMIDARYQQNGAGYEAVLRIIEKIADRPDRSDLIRLGYHPDNEAARRLYAKTNFVEEGVAPWGEMIAAFAY